MFGTLLTTPMGLLGGLGPWEVIVIALVALLLFGKRLPEVARSAGKAVVEFKKGLRDVEDDVGSQVSEETPKTPKPPEDEEKKG
jgi:sec-independent protein translocase protein TatA